MGISRWCVIESKSFELVVEGKSSTLWIFERGGGCVQSICLGKACLMVVDHCKGFDSRGGYGVLEMLQSWNSALLALWWSMEETGGGRRSGRILVPEGRGGKGWRSFAIELWSVLQLLQLSSGGGLAGVCFDGRSLQIAMPLDQCIGLQLPLPMEGSTASSSEPVGKSLVSLFSSGQFVLGVVVQERDISSNSAS